jgi:hypothetical protein
MLKGKWKVKIVDSGRPAAGSEPVILDFVIPIAYPPPKYPERRRTRW